MQYTTGDDILISYDTTDENCSIEIVQNITHAIQTMYPTSNVVALPKWITIDCIHRNEVNSPLWKTIFGEN